MTRRELPIATALSDLAGLPSGERYIFPRAPPGPLDGDRPGDPDERPPERFSHRLARQEPLRTSGGTVRIADASNFPAATTIAAALVEIAPGGLRELHRHPHADEWQYYIEGAGRMTVFAANATAHTFDHRASDVGYVPRAMGHDVENTGDTPLRFLEMFRSDRFADVSLNQWVALTPPASSETTCISTTA